jgi:hypothetical protein
MILISLIPSNRSSMHAVESHFARSFDRASITPRGRHHTRRSSLPPSWSAARMLHRGIKHSARDRRAAYRRRAHHPRSADGCRSGVDEPTSDEHRTRERRAVVAASSIVLRIECSDQHTHAHCDASEADSLARMLVALMLGRPPLRRSSPRAPLSRRSTPPTPSRSSSPPTSRSSSRSATHLMCPPHRTSHPI